MSVRKEIDRLLASYLDASCKCASRACADLYTKDGAIYSPYGPPAQGRAAIERIHRDWFEVGERNKKLDVVDLQDGGKIAVCLLRYSGEIPQPDGSWVEEGGVSLNLLKRQVDGSWLFHISSLNSDEPTQS